VGGAVLLIEGFHKGKPPGQDGKEEEVTTHESLSMLLYDANAKRYRFIAYTARQGYGEFEVKLIDGGWQWEMVSPASKQRFTITHTEKDEWSETGETSQDGKNWHKFFEMTLHRAK
jgi:VCBS repeat-containing protein